MIEFIIGVFIGSFGMLTIISLMTISKKADSDFSPPSNWIGEEPIKRDATKDQLSRIDDTDEFKGFM